MTNSKKWSYTKPMTKQPKMWQQVVCKTGVWLAVEIWLNIIGLDNIADYSEFIFAQDSELDLKNRKTVRINEYPPQFCPHINNVCPIPVTATKLINIKEYSSKVKAEIFEKKCQQLKEPCLKIMCMPSSDSNISINQVDYD